MKQDCNKSVLARGRGSTDPTSRCAPGFYLVLRLGLLSLLVLLALFKLAQSSREHRISQTGGPTAAPQSSVDMRQANPSPRAFRSQRRGVASPVDPIIEEVGSDLKHTKELALQRLEAALASAGSADKATAAALRRFASSGAMAELRAIKREDVQSLADYLSQSMSQQELSSLLEGYLSLSGAGATGPAEVKDTLVGIYDALSENYSQEVRPSALMITDGCQPDGRITGQTHELPGGTETVYAVFENDWSLAGLNQVLAVWRDPNDDSMVFTQFEPIRQGSAYNYVWLNVKEGWPAGRYKVELFHPEAQSLLLASESFSIR